MSPLAKALRRLVPVKAGVVEIAGAREAELAPDDRDAFIRVAQVLLSGHVDAIAQAQLERSHGDAELVAELLAAG